MRALPNTRQTGARAARAFERRRVGVEVGDVRLELGEDLVVEAHVSTPELQKSHDKTTGEMTRTSGIS